MAFVTSIPRQTRQGDGTVLRGLAISPPVQARRIVVRIDSPWPEGADVILLGIERSFDGLTWQHHASGPVYGGRRGKGGELPSVGAGVESGVLYRPFSLLSTPVEFGLEVDLR